MDMLNEFEKIMFFEQTCNSAEAAYAKDPLNVDNLMHWGGALLELASFQHETQRKKMTLDAISKLEEALEINPKRSEALWLLGNALMSLGLMTPAAEEAGSYFEEASGYLARASEEDPGNQLYLKSLEVAAMAPQLHAQFRRQQAEATETGPSANNQTPSRTNKNSNLKYDIMGWAILAVGIVAFTVYAQNNMPPPPPPRLGLSLFFLEI